MKKVFLLISLLALAACGISEKELAMHDADFSECERINTTKKHLVYRCPANLDWVAKIKEQQPNAKFFDAKNINWNAVNADTANVYVEVVYKATESCQDKFHYRTVVKTVDSQLEEMMYAVISCK